MAAEIRIHGNGLRLLNRYFLAIIPTKELAIKVGGIYSCMIDRIGEMGKIECTRITPVEIGNVDDRLNELCDNRFEHRRWFRDQGYFQTDKAQIGYFRFIRRIDDQFVKLLEIESKIIGLNLKPQQTLFD